MLSDPNPQYDALLGDDGGDDKETRCGARRGISLPTNDISVIRTCSVADPSVSHDLRSGVDEDDEDDEDEAEPSAGASARTRLARQPHTSAHCTVQPCSPARRCPAWRSPPRQVERPRLFSPLGARCRRAWLRFAQRKTARSKRRSAKHGASSGRRALCRRSWPASSSTSGSWRPWSTSTSR
jgi:hypothetical protein